MENPVLKRELKVRIRISKIIPAIVSRYVCLGFIFLLVLLARLGKGFLAFALAEAFFVLLFTPGAVCNAFVSNAARDDFRNLALTRLSSKAILLGKLAGANLYVCITILPAAFIMCAASFFHRNLHIQPVLFANVAILILVFISSVTSLAFSILFHRNAFVSVAFVYIIIFMLIGSIIIPGPLIKRIQEPRIKIAVIKAVLYINPLIMTSRAVGNVDIMRTRYMYNLTDPIVSHGFTYPDWYSIGVIYFGFSCFLLIPIFVGFRSRRCAKPPRTRGTSNE